MLQDTQGKPHFDMVEAATATRVDGFQSKIGVKSIHQPTLIRDTSDTSPFFFEAVFYGRTEARQYWSGFEIHVT